MPSTAPIRTLIVGAPLAFAALLMFHPNGDGDFFAGVSADTTAWLAVHIASAVLFFVMAYVVWLLLRGVHSRAATTARVSLPVFAVLYGVWESQIGIASGFIAREANTVDGAALQGLAGAVDRIVAHPVVGDGGVFNSIGALAWVVAVSATIVALHAIGVRRAALILLGVGAMMVMHVPPFGPTALVCLSAAGLLVERHRAAATRGGRQGRAEVPLAGGARWGRATSM